MKTAHPPNEQPPHFLSEPAETPETEAMFADDTQEMGFVMNASRLWAFQPATKSGLFDLLRASTIAGALTLRQRGLLVAATASTMGDAYCSIAWGSRLAEAIDAETAANVLRGDDTSLTEPEQAMTRWARAIVRSASATVPDDVNALRHAGFTDEQIFAITVYVALRIAFSTVNASLGAQPDVAFRITTPGPVLDAVTFGRPIQTEAPGARSINAVIDSPTHPGTRTTF